MPSAKIINFPKAARRRPPPAPLRYGTRSYTRRDAGGFAFMITLTVPAAFLYLSGAVNVARHDALYTVLLIAVWGIYFIHPLLLRLPVLGSLLVGAGRLMLFAGVAGFFGGLYWLVLSHP